MTLRVDHLVVAAATLAQGVAWCEQTLGVTPGPGGKHALMSTHNRLLKIASAAYPDAYLEIIAIDPDAPPPGRARWFGLDDAALQARLPHEGPSLIHVVARSTAMEEQRAALLAAGYPPGEVLSASRETPQGLLSWLIAVRADGQLACEGALPTLIQWQGPHPAAQMPDAGLALRALSLRGLPERARAALGSSGFSYPAAPGPALQAELATPRGVVRLKSFANP